jgi:hypothetical protein
VDGRSAVARRYRDNAAQIIADMGGTSQCAFNSFAASRRQPFLPSKWKRDWQMATRSTSPIMHCCHRLQRIGIDRPSRNITPSLSEYLELQSKRIDAEAQ